MIDLLAAKDNAERQYHSAHYILHKTFPLSNDPKLLLGITKNIYQAVESAIDAIIAFDLKKQLPESLTSNTKLAMFTLQIAEKYEIPKESIVFVNRLRSIISMQKSSPVEFRRKDAHVICSDEYNLEKLSVEEVKSYLGKAKEFLGLMENIISGKKTEE